MTTNAWTLDSNTHRIAVETHGDAGVPSIIMLHSSGLSGRQWRPYAVELAKMGYQVHLPDLVGYGKSEPWQGSRVFDIAEEIQLVESLIQARPAAQTHLVGHSYGGLIALLAALNNQDIASVLVYEPVCWGILADQGSEQEVSIFERFEALGFFEDEGGGSDQWLEQFVNYWNGDGAWQMLPEGMRQSMSRTGRKTFEEVRSLCFDRTPASAYQTLEMPVRVLNGLGSPHEIQRICAYLTEAIPHATNTTFATGHMGPVTHGPLIVPEILQWFARLK